MDFRILGPLAILDEDVTVTLSGSKQRALLALFLLHANETLSADRLIDDLWGARPPPSAPKALQVHISRLRKALVAGAGHGWAADGMVVTREHGYALELDPERLDSHRFERLVADGSRELAANRPEPAARALEQALSLWRGEPLGDLAFEPFVQREIARLEDLRVAALERLIDAKLALGRHAEVLTQLETLIGEHPFREHLRAQLMLALYRSERQADALQAYQEARRALVEELGIEPGARLRSLERAILAQDPGLQLLAPVAPTAVEPTARVAVNGDRSPRGSTPSTPRAGTVVLLEREQALDELRSAWELTRAGHGRLVVIEGPAGSGKSALLSAATDGARAAGLRVLGARAHELERGYAFGAIRQLFETVITAAAPAEREALLAGAAAPAAWVVAPGAGRDTAGRADAGFAALHGIYWLATNLSLASPLLLVVDDLHWVDGSSLRSLAYLSRRIADLPIALVVALRPDEPGSPVELLDELRAQPDAAPISLRPLRPESVSTVVRTAIPDADEALCSACFEASAGNPFYLRELLRAIVADGPGADAAAVVGEASIRTIGDQVVRRIARIGPAAVALARAMAVLDDGGRLSDAAALAGLDGATAGRAAARMRRIEVLAAEDPFAFVHPLVRRSVYDGLPVAERDTAHGAAAQRLQAGGGTPEAVAAHLAELRPAGSAGVAAALRDAAKEAIARAAPEAAIGWLRRALAEAAPEPPRALLLHELGQVEVFGRDPAAIEHLQQALELAAEPVLRARVARDLYDMLVATGQWEAAVRITSAALDELGNRDPQLAVELEFNRATARAYDPGLVADFNRDRSRLLSLAAGETWGARALSVLLAAVAACRGEDLEQVRALVEHGLRDGRLLAERGAGGMASAQALVPLVATEADDRALEVVEELAAQARRSGALIGTVTAIGFRGWIRARHGDLAAAEADLRTCLDVSTQNGLPLLSANAFLFFAETIQERPSLDDVAALVETLELAPDFLPTVTGSMLLEARGRLRLARGERQGALADLRACAATYRALGFGPTWTSWRSALALALPAQARDEALALAEEETALAAATPLARPRAVALRTAGLLRGGQDGIACLRQSVGLLEDSAARLEHARSLVELGAALRRRGQRAEAREPLAAGMERAHRCGAERLVARAHEELHAAGARPRRPALAGVEALTASEQRIARLAADGRSNTQLAQELFVSPKTVETHLSHAYAKLGLSGRGARQRLAAALERPQP